MFDEKVVNLMRLFITLNQQLMESSHFWEQTKSQIRIEESEDFKQSNSLFSQFKTSIIRSKNVKKIFLSAYST